MGWMITFLILFLLAILPLGVSIRYSSDGFVAKVILGLLKITVFPLPSWLKKKKKKPVEAPPGGEKKPEKKEKPKKEKPKTDEEQSEKPKPKGGSLKDFLPLAKLGLDFLGDFRRKLRLNHLELKLVMAGDDPCDVAVNYGRAWAALSNLVPRLERVFVIKKREMEVLCDFTASEMLVTARLDISITLGRLIGLAVYYGVKALIIFLKIKKKRKGGA